MFFRRKEYLETRKFVDKYLFYVIHNELPICGKMADWETWDPIRGLKLFHLISFRMVLIWQANLGRCMMPAKRALGLLSSGSRSKDHGIHNAQLFSS